MNRRTALFRAQFAALPPDIQRAATAAFRMFLRDPRHFGLRCHPLQPTRRGQHLPGSVSVAITMSYRAITVVQGDINVWYWIGSHADYDSFTSRR